MCGINFLERIFLFVCWLILITMVVLSFTSSDGGGGGGDTRLRHNEIRCSHYGKNPFHIWNHDYVDVSYQGIQRPDYDYQENSNKLNVHSYPPWHTTYFWWYGWLKQSHCVMFVRVLNILIMIGALFYFGQWRPQGIYRQVFFYSVLGMLFSFAFNRVMIWGNYGALIMAASIIMYEALKRNKVIVVGFAWAFMMIKPQVGMLFFWPLFFAKKYWSIMVAVIVCVLASFWPAYMYNESIIDLIRQVPLSGAPYMDVNKHQIAFILCRFVGENGTPLWMIFCFFLCGLLSFLLRKSSSWMIRFLPVLMIFPLWTYSQEHDMLVQWVFFLLIAQYLSNIDIVKSHGAKKYRTIFYSFFLLMAVLVKCSWVVLVTEFSIINPTGLGWVFYAAIYLLQALLVIFGLRLCYADYLQSRGDK